MENLEFDRGHGRNFDHLLMVILKYRPWSCSKIFDTSGVRQMVKKLVPPYPPPPSLFVLFILFVFIHIINIKLLIAIRIHNYITILLNHFLLKGYVSALHP